jgi:hypothetical protein
VGQSPQFKLVSKPSLYRSISDALSALWETEPRVIPIRLNGGTSWPRERSLLPAFLASLLINFAVLFFLYRVPFTWLYHAIRGYPLEPAHHYSVIVYKIQVPQLPPYLPIEQPPKAGGTPGSNASAGKHAARGGTRWEPRVKIISNPKRPDNFHQTIIQPAAPRNLKLLEDVQLPDLVVIPTASVAPVAPKPIPLPQLAISPPKELPPLAMPTVAQTPRPRPTPAAVIPLPTAPLQALNEALAPPSPPASQPAPKTPGPQPQTAGIQASGKLLSLSINPGPLKNVLALPLGNRLGAFSVSQSGSHQGSPGGSPGSRGGSRSQGSGPGGDVSISTGPGGNGGGGVGSANIGGTFSISGGVAGASAFIGGTLPPLDADALIYPVNTVVRLRKGALVVSAGPAGGGGLGVYGVLECGRIFTIYLPMTPRNWILQYCAPQSDPPAVPATNVVEIRMDSPLSPPAPARQFDFHRPALRSDLVARMVILHGTIQKDGSVGGLRLLRGVQDRINQAAMAAFAHWKFSPALRQGKPVAVEILVGIPVAAE